MRQIGLVYEVSKTSVRRWLAFYEIPCRTADRGLLNRGIPEPTAAQLHGLVHNQHLGYREIADMYGVDPSAVGHWVTRLGIVRPTIWGTRRKGVPMPYPPPEEVRTRYGEGEPLESIAKGCGVSRSALRDYCQRNGIEIRPDGWIAGRRWMCADGHAVRSSFEQRVDDWLGDNGLDHELEPRLPFDRRSQGDFLVAGRIYVEVWGVVGSVQYEERRKRKAGLYRAHGLPLVELPVWTFARGAWARRLSAALLPGHDRPRSQGWRGGDGQGGQEVPGVPV